MEEQDGKDRPSRNEERMKTKSTEIWRVRSAPIYGWRESSGLLAPARVLQPSHLLTRWAWLRSCQHAHHLIPEPGHGPAPLRLRQESCGSGMRQDDVLGGRVPGPA